MKKVISMLLLVSGAAFFAGCAQQQTTPEAPTEPEQPAADTAGATTEAAPALNPLDDPNSPLAKRVFYFPFDSSEVDPADRDILAAHAGYLAANPSASISIEGHADERGSREYNLALGERRAQAIQKLMSVQGMARNQGATTSFGEERPAAQGHDEMSWSQNRRVELKYQGR